MKPNPPSRRRFLSLTAGAAGGAALAPLLQACRSFDDELRAVDASSAAEPGAYTLDPRIAYLNHGSIGTVPRIVQQAHGRYLASCESNPWLHLWSGLWDDARERTRASAAELLGCDPAEVAINHNTTEGFNLLASGLPLEPGDEVLFSSLNHAGASVCFERRAAERGYVVRRFDFPIDRVSELTADEIVALHEAHVTDRTRLLVLPHIDNTVGLRHPVRELVAMARRRGVDFVAVDGAQSLGMIPVDVRDLGVDFYCASPHKWVQSPKGLGLLYVRRELQPALRPYHVTWGQQRWAGTVRVFEDFGTRNLPELLALGDAVEFQLQRDVAAGAERLLGLREHVRARVADEPRIAWRSPVDWDLGASLYAIEVVGKRADDMFTVLWDGNGIVVRAFGGEINTLRISPNIMNTTAEIDRMFDVLQREVLA